MKKSGGGFWDAVTILVILGALYTYWYIAVAILAIFITIKIVKVVKVNNLKKELARLEREQLLRRERIASEVHALNVETADLAVRFDAAVNKRNEAIESIDRHIAETDVILEESRKLRERIDMEIMLSKSGVDFDSMTGEEFEQYCMSLLSMNGYDALEQTKASGDQGVDVLAVRDGVKYGIQCKRYSGVVGNKAVQEAYAGRKFYDCHVAVVITNQFFTTSAQELADKSGVVLWDRNKLLELQVESVSDPIVSK